VSLALAPEVLRICEPPPALTVSEWSDAERLLPESSAARSARYRTAFVEYLRDVMDQATAPSVTRLAVMKAHQVGASEALYNVLGYHMQHQPSPMLLVMPTADAGQAVAKERIGDLIRSCPAVGAIVQSKRSPGPLAAPESTLNMILFPGGFLAIGGANTPNTFARAAVRLAIGDDCDRWPPVVGEEGDPADLLANRTTSFHDGRALFVSTPTMKRGRIDSLYAGSDQRRFHVTCPNCRRADWITWNDPAHWRVVYDEHNPKTARLECGRCGHVVREPERMALVRAGTWRPTAATATAGQIGFHIPAMLSPFVTLHGLVERWLDANQRGRESLRTFVNTSLAEPWEDEDRAIRIGAADGLMQQREGYDAVPMAASWITASIDVQDDRFELLFCGWGARDEAWVLHHEVLHRDAGYDPFAASSWERLYRELVSVRFDHVAGVKLPVCTTVIDSGYQTMHAYRFNRMDRRHIFATKGVRTLEDAHFIKFSQDKDSAMRRGVALVLVATDLGKQRVADRVADGRLHFPVADWCGEEFFAQLTAETCEPIFNPAGVRVGQKWVKQRPRNEVLDLLVLNFAARAIRGTQNLDAYRAQMGLPPT
jgi:phage terminase large subunit GpA-like protein